jgi:signal transduction histidine kinase
MNVHENHHTSTQKKRSFGSLKGRIQSGMFLSALITVSCVIFIIILPLVFLTFIPTAYLLSNTVSQDIYSRLDTMLAQDHMKPPGHEADMLKSKTLDELLLYANDMYENRLEFDLMSTESLQSDKIVIESMSPDFQKMAVIAILSGLSDFNQKLPITAIFPVDFILIELKDASNNKILCIPIEDELYGIAAYQNGRFRENVLFKSVFNASKTQVHIETPTGDLLGSITVSINPQLASGILWIFVALLVIGLVLALPIDLILIKVHAKNILKPVDQLTNQLAVLATNDFYGIMDFHFKVKKPPRELVRLMDSATQIMEKLNDFNQELDAQKQELEAQNTELEAQNQTLHESSVKIQQQQDQLVRSEKMATLGQISAAIAHEINTPLGAIKSNTQMMTHVLTTLPTEQVEEPLRSRLEKLKNMNAITHDASDRVSEIIRSLKNFSRIDQADFQDFDINEGIESVLVLTSNLWKNTVVIEKYFGDHQIISAFASLLNQVFMNIVVNAIQAMPDGGTLRIETALTDQHAIVSFHDTGVGIPEDDLERIFQSGFTTKAYNQGTGLGLSISREIINKHSGKLYAKNHANGASFIIELPLNQKTT